MDWLIQVWSGKPWVVVSGIVGDVLLIVGIVTAALDKTFAGFTPVVWLLLAFVCFWTMLFCVVLRILKTLEAKPLN